MDSFAFIIHPIDPKRDVSRKYPLLGILPERVINFGSRFFPPVYISQIDGIRSVATGKEITGWFVACPLTPGRMLELPVKTVYRKIVQTGHLAEKLGAQILGLGAFTSVVGDGGITIARQLDIPVTSGDAYTIAVAVEAIQRAAERMDIKMDEASAAVVGAGGAIGQVCAELLSDQVSSLMLIGRTQERLERLKARLSQTGRSGEIHITTDPAQLKDAQIIITVTSALASVIQPEYLRPGSVICDVARPRDVSAQVSAAREDVLVIDGGMVDVPGEVNFHFDFGFPAGKAYACMAETIALTLEGRFEDYTLGKEIHVSQVRQITQIARKHGFKLSGFRSFEKAVSDEKIELVRLKAKNHVKSPVWAPGSIPE